MKPKRNYETEAQKLAKAIDIAIEAFEKFPPDRWTKENLSFAKEHRLETKDNVLNPEQKFKSLASLKYAIEATFTIFNEGSGDFVEYFWKEIKNQNLDYVREDKLYKILQRGKIRGRIEYEYLIDVLVPAEQENRITSEEAQLLGKMIDAFENKKAK
jgi:hypothetical protein